MLLNSSGRVENLLLPGELDINQLGQREKIRNGYSLDSAFSSILVKDLLDKVPSQLGSSMDRISIRTRLSKCAKQQRSIS